MTNAEYSNAVLLCRSVVSECAAVARQCSKGPGKRIPRILIGVDANAQLNEDQCLVCDLVLNSDKPVATRTDMLKMLLHSDRCAYNSCSPLDCSQTMEVLHRAFSPEMFGAPFSDPHLHPVAPPESLDAFSCGMTTGSTLWPPFTHSSWSTKHPHQIDWLCGSFPRRSVFWAVSTSLAAWQRSDHLPLVCAILCPPALRTCSRPVVSDPGPLPASLPPIRPCDDPSVQSPSFAFPCPSDPRDGVNFWKFRGHARRYLCTEPWRKLQLLRAHRSEPWR